MKQKKSKMQVKKKKIKMHENRVHTYSNAIAYTSSQVLYLLHHIRKCTYFDCNTRFYEISIRIRIL